MQDNLDTILQKINSQLEDGALYYLANDPERALGLEKLLKNYHIVYIDKSQYGKSFTEAQQAHFCLDEAAGQAEELFRSSLKLIKHNKFLEYFNSTKKARNFIQTFKISPAFEIAVKNLGATLVNTSGDLNRKFEGKLEQSEFLSSLQINWPKALVFSLAEKSYQDLVAVLNTEFVVQFDRGHTGSGTNFIKTEADYTALLEKFPDRRVRAVEFVHGTPYTLNVCVLRQGIVMGGLSRQITGVKGLTPEPGGTVGNDWSERAHWTSGLEALQKDVEVIGLAMRENGYLGLFGIDLIVDADGKHKIIEINARQPASMAMYNKIQLTLGQIPLGLLHLAEFMGIDYQIDVKRYNEQALQAQAYSQIFVRADRPVSIRCEIPQGYYRLQGDNAAIDRPTQTVRANTIFIDEDKDKSLLFYGSGYSIDAADQAGLILLTPCLGRNIKYNEEIGRLQLTQGAYADQAQLKPWIVEALKAIKDYQI